MISQQVDGWITNSLNMVKFAVILYKKTFPELQRQDVLRAQRWGSGGAPEKQKHPDWKW